MAGFAPRYARSRKQPQPDLSEPGDVREKQCPFFSLHATAAAVIDLLLDEVLDLLEDTIDIGG